MDLELLPATADHVPSGRSTPDTLVVGASHTSFGSASHVAITRTPDELTSSMSSRRKRVAASFDLGRATLPPTDVLLDHLTAHRRLGAADVTVGVPRHMRKEVAERPARERGRTSCRGIVDDCPDIVEAPLRGLDSRKILGRSGWTFRH